MNDCAHVWIHVQRSNEIPFDAVCKTCKKMRLNVTYGMTWAEYAEHRARGEYVD